MLAKGRIRISELSCCQRSMSRRLKSLLAMIVRGANKLAIAKPYLRLGQQMSSGELPEDSEEYKLREALHNRSMNLIIKTPFPHRLVSNPLFKLPFDRRAAMIARGVRIADSLLWSITTGAVFFYGGWMWSLIPGSIAIWKWGRAIAQIYNLRTCIAEISLSKVLQL